MRSTQVPATDHNRPLPCASLTIGPLTPMCRLRLKWSMLVAGTVSVGQSADGKLPRMRWVAKDRWARPIAICEWTPMPRARYPSNERGSLQGPGCAEWSSVCAQDELCGHHHGDYCIDAMKLAAQCAGCAEALLEELATRQAQVLASFPRSISQYVRESPAVGS